MIIQTYLSFVRGSRVPGDIADMLGYGVGFVPESVEVGGREVRFTEAALEKVRMSVGGFGIEGSDGSISFGSSAGLAADLVVLRAPTEPSVELIDFVVKLPGFVSWVVGDADDVFWQSAHLVNTYSLFNKSLDGLTVSPHSLFKEGVIDISQNPGRQSRAPGMWLWAGSRMIFGPAAFLTLDRERLMSCPVGSVRERDDGLIEVELYSLPIDDVDAVRLLQREFRDWMGYDDIESRASELIPPAHPAMEFERGSFSHGGVLRVTEWLRAGELVYRPDATEQRIYEVDESGNLVWEETTDRDATADERP